MAERTASPVDLTDLRRIYAKQMLAISGVDDPRVEAAFAAVPREDFLGPEPWRIVRYGGRLQPLPSNDPLYVYQDVLIALQPDRGVNNGSPSLHALLLHNLGAEPGDRVCHIGAGTGYYSAILAELVGPSGRVTAVEFDPALAERAREALKPWPQVEVVRGDGAVWPQQKVDRVYVNVAVAEPAAAWTEWLAEGGTLVFPLGAPSPAPLPGAPRHSAEGAAFRIARRAVDHQAAWLCPVFFVFAEGVLAGDEDTQRRLAHAFQRGGAEFVRSLRRGTPADPARCWFWSPGWSLCFDPPPVAV